jgi:hypothetical protein
VKTRLDVLQRPLFPQNRARAPRPTRQALIEGSEEVFAWKKRPSARRERMAALVRSTARFRSYAYTRDCTDSASAAKMSPQLVVRCHDITSWECDCGLCRNHPSQPRLRAYCSRGECLEMPHSAQARLLTRLPRTFSFLRKGLMVRMHRARHQRRSTGHGRLHEVWSANSAM